MAKSAEPSVGMDIQRTMAFAVQIFLAYMLMVSATRVASGRASPPPLPRGWCWFLDGPVIPVCLARANKTLDPNRLVADTDRCVWFCGGVCACLRCMSLFLTRAQMAAAGGYNSMVCDSEK